MKKFTFPKKPQEGSREKEDSPYKKRVPSPEPYTPAMDGRKPRAAVSLIPPKSAERAENKQVPKFQPKYPGMPRKGPQTSKATEEAKPSPAAVSSKETQAAQTLQAWCRVRLQVNKEQGNVRKDNESRKEHESGNDNVSDAPEGCDASGVHETQASRDETEPSTSKPMNKMSPANAQDVATGHDAGAAQVEKSPGWARDAVQRKTRTIGAVQTNHDAAAKRGADKDKTTSHQPQGSYSAYNPAHIIPSAKKVKELIDSSPLKTRVPRNLRLYDQQRSRMLKLGGVEYQELRQPSPDILHESKVVEEEVDTQPVDETTPVPKEDEGSAAGHVDSEQAEEEVTEVEQRPANTPDAVIYPDWSPSKTSLDRALEGDRKELVEEVCRQHATREKFVVLRKAGLWQPNIDSRNPPSTVLEGVFEILSETGLVPDVVTKEEAQKLFQPQPNVDEKPAEEVEGDSQRQEREEGPETERKKDGGTEDEEQEESEPPRSQSCEPVGSQSEDPNAERPKKVSFAPAERQSHKAAASKAGRRHSVPDRKRRRKPSSQNSAKLDADLATFVRIITKIAENLDLEQLEHFHKKRNAAAAAERARTKTPWSSAHPVAAARPRTSVRQLMMAQDQMRLQHTQKLRLKQQQKEQYLSELSERQRKKETAWEQKEDRKRRWLEALQDVEVLVSTIRNESFDMSPQYKSNATAAAAAASSSNTKPTAALIKARRINSCANSGFEAGEQAERRACRSFRVGVPTAGMRRLSSLTTNVTRGNGSSCTSGCTSWTSSTTNLQTQPSPPAEDEFPLSRAEIRLSQR